MEGHGVRGVKSVCGGGLKELLGLSSQFYYEPEITRKFKVEKKIVLVLTNTQPDQPNPEDLTTFL